MKEDALKSLKTSDNIGGFSSYESNKLAINSKKPKDKDEDKNILLYLSSENTNTNTEKDKDSNLGFTYNLNSWMSSAIDNTKILTEKVINLEIGSKLMETGNVLATQGSNLVDKATVITVG